MATVAAILAALATLAGLVLWLLKRVYDPSPNQRLTARERELETIMRRITVMRARGDHAGADALRRMLLSQTLGGARQLNPTLAPAPHHPAPPLGHNGDPTPFAPDQ